MHCTTDMSRIAILILAPPYDQFRNVTLDNLLTARGFSSITRRGLSGTRSSTLGEGGTTTGVGLIVPYVLLLRPRTFGLVGGRGEDPAKAWSAW